MSQDSACSSVMLRYWLVIGGTSLFGAIGTVQGPLIGSFLLATIRNGANLLNVNPFWQQIITGALIIIIVYMDSLRRRRN